MGYQLLLTLKLASGKRAVFKLAERAEVPILLL